MLPTLHGLWLRDQSLAWVRGCAADSALEEQKGSPLLLPPPPSSARSGTNWHPLDLSLSPRTQREWLASASGGAGKGAWLAVHRCGYSHLRRQGERAALQRAGSRPGDREVGGSALRSDQSPQLAACIGPLWPVVPGGRASVPSSCEGLGSPGRFLSPGEGRSPLGPEGRQGLGSGSPSLRPGSPRRPSPGAAWSPLEVPSRRLQIMH